ncbi:MAG: hypothetical protein GY813_07550 [Halieaceae bacterium]|nr:hypothetical protein [Halieaceae bacterium]
MSNIIQVKRRFGEFTVNFIEGNEETGAMPLYFVEQNGQPWGQNQLGKSAWSSFQMMCELLERKNAD